MADLEAGEAYWSSLEDVISFGAIRVDEREFCQPYYSCSAGQPALIGLNIYNAAVLVEKDVAVYEGPDTETRVIETLSFAVVELGTFLDDLIWAEIKLPSGQEGYIERRTMRPPVGFKAVFEQRPAGWVLASFRIGNE